ncbi:MAG: leucyl aminopeptidase, partial [Planctomycetota bacterium]|nr:leucyl aminopeptidase [Planctomycetota bacterium]
ERVWRLPLWPVYREQIAGADGDIKNIGGRPAGAITAAMFLKEFVADKTPWAHLDIAGPATTLTAQPYCPVGATGYGVRLLMDYLQELS